MAKTPKAKRTAAKPPAASPVKALKPAVTVESKQPKRTVKLMPVWLLTKQASLLFWRHKRVFIGITLVYGLLNVVLAQGLGGTDVGSLKNQLGQVFTGNTGALTSSLVVFASLIGSAGNSSNGTAGAYQLFLALIASLAVIWALRQTTAGAKFRVRDAYYRGMYPLVPFVLVLLVVVIQLLPLAIGSTIYNVVLTQGIAVTGLEKAIWGVVFASLALLSLYLLSSSLFGLYIVTLPDMTPLKALRSARQLVRGRRWTVLRKILFVVPLLLLAAAVIMIPFILLLTVVAKYIFFLLTVFALVAVHGYMYTLYRELLRD
ncbi:MAG: hypothetical protein QFB87_02455 [Patescibacteria group bacterium]|nr:hypothetical protein [Patescibacteria group bacterium]